MITSKKLLKQKNISHGFFNRNGGKSSGIYRSLNCGVGSKDKKFLVKCYGKVKHLIKFNEFLSESETSMDNHWQNTYLFNKDILENKKCVDVGIWYGVSNAYAAESFNLKTTHGIDPNKNFTDICSQILPGIKVYETIAVFLLLTLLRVKFGFSLLQISTLLSKVYLISSSGLILLSQ